MNNCVFIGNICNDIELRQAGQAQVVNVNLAVDKYSKAAGKGTVFVPLTVWNKDAERLAQHAQKGTKIAVTCEFDMQEWQDNDGNKRKTPKFTVWRWEFAGSKTQGQQPQNQGAPQQMQPQQNWVQPTQNQPPQCQSAGQAKQQTNNNQSTQYATNVLSGGSINGDDIPW